MSTIVVTKLANGVKVKEGSRKAYTITGKPDEITPKTGTVSIWVDKKEYLFSLADTFTFDGVAFVGTTEEDLADSFRTIFNVSGTTVSQNVNGQATMANSAPVAIASNQSAIPVNIPAVSATGTISTQNLVPAGAATASSAVEITLNGASTLAVQTVGTFTGALSLQGTLDGTTWLTIGGAPFLDRNGGTSAVSVTSALQTIEQVNVAGFLKARISALAAVTGSVTVTLIATMSPGLVALGGPLLTGTNVIGSIAPTSTTGFNTYYHLVSAATTNAVSVKTSQACVGAIALYNTNAAVRYVKFYNKASAPTVGTDTPVFTFAVAPSGSVVVQPALGIRMTTGLAIATTTEAADSGTTAVGAGDLIINISYT